MSGNSFLFYAAFNFGSLGIAGMMKKKGGVGRASPAQHPHIFP
jgi:hypothetical protein